MSYCHLLGGGIDNIALSLGTGHPYGINPGRVPNRMDAHIVSAAGSNPTCLAPILFGDGFETGTSRWDSVVGE